MAAICNADNTISNLWKNCPTQAHSWIKQIPPTVKYKQELSAETDVTIHVEH